MSQELTDYLDNGRIIEMTEKYLGLGDWERTIREREPVTYRKGDYSLSFMVSHGQFQLGLFTVGRNFSEIDDITDRFCAKYEVPKRDTISLQGKFKPEINPRTVIRSEREVREIADQTKIVIEELLDRLAQCNSLEKLSALFDQGENWITRNHFGLYRVLIAKKLGGSTDFEELAAQFFGQEELPALFQKCSLKHSDHAYDDEFRQILDGLTYGECQSLSDIPPSLNKHRSRRTGYFCFIVAKDKDSEPLSGTEKHRPDSAKTFCEMLRKQEGYQDLKEFHNGTQSTFGDRLGSRELSVGCYDNAVVISGDVFLANAFLTDRPVFPYFAIRKAISGKPEIFAVVINEQLGRIGYSLHDLSGEPGLQRSHFITPDKIVDFGDKLPEEKSALGGGSFPSEQAERLELMENIILDFSKRFFKDGYKNENLANLEMLKLTK